MMESGSQADSAADSGASPAGRSFATGLRLTLGFTLAALVIVGCLWFRSSGRQVSQPGGGKPQRPTHQTKGSPGPWGELEYVPIVIATPDEFLSVAREANIEPVWRFGKYSAGQVHDLLVRADPPAAAREWLMDERHWQVSADGVVIAPPPEVIFTLDPASRALIYNALANLGGNLLQEFPLSRSRDGLEDWFSKGGLSAPTITLTRSLLYQRGSAWCLADWPLLLRQVPSREERRQLLKAATSQTTLLAHLRIRENADVEGLVEYWGRGGRAKDIRALLESVALVEGGATVDLAHLLPRFVRERIYTYPFPTDPTLARRRNCFWTSLNFFANGPPEDRHADAADLRLTLAKDYVQVPGDLLLGDVLLWSKADGTPVHAASYLAADLVLTKNGAYHTQPWMLSRLDDLLVRYPSSSALSFAAYRRKDLAHGLGRCPPTGDTDAVREYHTQLESWRGSNPARFPPNAWADVFTAGPARTRSARIP
ncbi:MAG: hypothetical protein FD161_3241 [Limisphaerales bacterium]|nr:MAG: hypothetical protein FD161_3241 [Limisphaerales bacterium]KAG0507941.1 MAG: hypothetical protein E1N63_2907 [Limisphaerales bacterium]TXT48347.1 MAG: hypothetical protein FD140_3664 [Limisphaerales bacterium]